MPVDTEDEIIEKDEDLKATESRIVELRQKKDRTPEEDKEFKELRQHHRGRVEEQILSEREKAAQQQERAAKAEQALEDARQRLKALEEKRDTGSSSSGGAGENESIVINGKKFYTDEAINIRVQKGLMTQAGGWRMQREAIKEEAKAEMAGDLPQRKAQETREKSLEYVKEQGYGHFLDAKDPKHNPNDPLFKEAERLWKNGYQYDPDGPRKALDDAKRFLGTGIKREDRSDDLTVPKNNSASDSNALKEKKVVLSEIEQQNAIRFWVDGNVQNPKTGKNYTESEALAKALDAKRKRYSK